MPAVLYHARGSRSPVRVRVRAGSAVRVFTNTIYARDRASHGQSGFLRPVRESHARGEAFLARSAANERYHRPTIGVLASAHRARDTRRPGLRSAKGLSRACVHCETPERTSINTGAGAGRARAGSYLCWCGCYQGRACRRGSLAGDERSPGNPERRETPRERDGAPVHRCSRRRRRRRRPAPARGPDNVTLFRSLRPVRTIRIRSVWLAPHALSPCACDHYYHFFFASFLYLYSVVSAARTSSRRLHGSIIFFEPRVADS